MTELDIKTEKQAQAFYELVKDIIQTEEYGKMQSYRHHLHGSTFEHSIKVAYLCYKHHLKHKCKVPLNELIRAALLHDYFLYNHHSKAEVNGKTGLMHIWHHPKRALENAKKSYPDLTRAEQNAIKRHMFPLTPIPPSTRCGWLICFYDKVAAIGDYCNRGAWKKALKPCLVFFKDGGRKINILKLTFHKQNVIKTKIKIMYDKYNKTKRRFYHGNQSIFQEGILRYEGRRQGTARGR